jgi:hypothetical protein
MPAALEQVILRALRKDPRERHATAAAFAADVRAAMDGRPVEFAPLPEAPVPVPGTSAPPPVPVAGAVVPMTAAAAVPPPVPAPPPVPQTPFSASPPPVPPPLPYAAATVSSQRRVWPWVAGGCLVLLVVPCLLSTMCALTGGKVRKGGTAGAPAPTVPWDTLPESIDWQSAAPIPESQRAAMVQGIIQAANDAMSGDACEIVKQTVPRIPGGITASELADACDDMMKGDRKEAIVAVAPYVRPGMTSEDIERLTGDLFSGDKPAVLLALTGAGSALKVLREQAEPPPEGGMSPGPPPPPPLERDDDPDPEKPPK